MYEMRYTVIDAAGTVSFVGPCHALKMLVAACAKMPADLTALLEHLRALDAQVADHVVDGLAVFDEHHVSEPGNRAGGEHPQEAGADAGSPAPAPAPPVFRVVDHASRQASLQPIRAGAVIFNLPERRIIQLQNSYADVQRQDRGRLRRDGRPVQTFYHYDLPAEWRILP
jgi:hypothetical protein